MRVELLYFALGYVFLQTEVVSIFCCFCRHVASSDQKPDFIVGAWWQELSISEYLCFLRKQFIVAFVHGSHAILAKCKQFAIDLRLHGQYLHMALIHFCIPIRFLFPCLRKDVRSQKTLLLFLQHTLPFLDWISLKILYGQGWLFKILEMFWFPACLGGFYDPALTDNLIYYSWASAAFLKINLKGINAK